MLDDSEEKTRLVTIAVGKGASGGRRTAGRNNISTAPLKEQPPKAEFRRIAFLLVGEAENGRSPGDG